MATHLRNLLSPSQSDPADADADADADAGGALSCSYTDCHLNSDGYRFCSSYSCFWKTLSPPPPPAAPQTESPQTTHLAPYLIAMVCVLGITFLFLTTCTIILRYRFSQRRNSIRRTSASVGHFAFDDDDHGSPVDHPIWHITTVGLQQSVIDSIAVFKYKKVDGLIEGNDCSVCLTEFQDGDDLRLLPKCSHAFHVSCIDTWLRSHKNCPMCRAPVVNESFWGNFSVGRSSSRDLNSRDEILTGSSTMDGGSESWEGESSHQMRDRGDDFGPLPIEGTRIAAMLKKNRELRVLSDLGEQLRFKGGGREGEDFQPIRRSASLDLAAACGIFNDMANVCLEKNEGSSSNASLGQVKLGIEKDVKRGSSMSVLGKCSSSIGRSLQKVPISAKRSSSSSRIFSFRRSKSQASILPL